MSFLYHCTNSSQKLCTPLCACKQTLLMETAVYIRENSHRFLQSCKQKTSARNASLYLYTNLKYMANVHENGFLMQPAVNMVNNSYRLLTCKQKSPAKISSLYHCAQSRCRLLLTYKSIQIHLYKFKQTPIGKHLYNNLCLCNHIIKKQQHLLPIHLCTSVQTNNAQSMRILYVHIINRPFLM